MEFIVKPLSNSIEYITTRGQYKGKHKAKYIVKHISISITADDPTDLMLMSMHRKPIEEAIIQELNKNMRRNKNDNCRS